MNARRFLSRLFVLFTLVLLAGAPATTSQAHTLPRISVLEQSRTGPDDRVPSHPGLDASVHPSFFASPRAVASAVPSPVLSWLVETVDSSDDAGEHASVAVDAQDRPHISYYNATHGALLYTHREGYRWFTSTVDSDLGQTGEHTSLALNAQGQPSVSYRRVSHIPLQPPVTRLRFATYDGKHWNVEDVDVIGADGGHTSLALDSQGRPHIAYYEGQAGALMMATLEGSEWSSEMIDGFASDVGQYTSLILDANGAPHISYVDVTNHHLKYARWYKGDWQIETVDDGRSVDGETSLALDDNGRPHISYHDARGGGLWYATAPAPGDWESTQLASVGGGAAYNSLDLDANDHPHIAYYDASAGALSYAFFTGSQWAVETVDDAGTVGSHASLVLDSTGKPHVAYYDETHGDLKYASDVPTSAHRRAKEAIEEVRGTAMAPGWDAAELGPPVVPFFRPDVQGIAYFEFPVFVPSTDVSAAPSLEPAGFIFVSTGPHDVPIPEWSHRGQPPSLDLKQEAEKLGDVASKFFKLDPLFYVAENTSGEEAATLGPPPMKFSGMDPDWVKNPPPTVEEMFTPGAQAADDGALVGQTGAEVLSAAARGATTTVTGTEVVSGSVTATLEASPWDSWEDMKAGYGEAYSVTLSILAQGAGEAWDVHEMVEDGGVLYKGDERFLPALWPSPAVCSTGEAVDAGCVDTALVDQPGLDPIVRVRAVDSVLGEALPFTVTIAYGNGSQEVFRFTVVEPYQTWLPMVIRGGGATARTMAAPAPLLQPQGFWSSLKTGWTSWTHSVAGDHDDQCWYTQLDCGEDPNTSNFYSGCGSTAWAMLFGWADRQADAGNTYWSGRWGIYRVDGGPGPSTPDAVAPTHMTDGVKNMTWEIRNYLDPTCLAWRGCDLAYNDPGDMKRARDYIRDRSFTSLYVQHNGTIVPNKAARDRAGNTIRDRQTPAVIGVTLDQAHYALAYKYRRRRFRVAGVTVFRQKQFYINYGWGGKEKYIDGYMVWLAGEIRPSSLALANDVDDVALFRTATADQGKWIYDFGHNGTMDSASGPWGKQDGDQPLAGDFDRDGIVDDVAIFRPSNGSWHYSYDHDSGTDEQGGPWGVAGDLPFAGDFDNDGYLDDVAYFKPWAQTWCYDHDHDNAPHICDEWVSDWGYAEGVPFAGDFDPEDQFANDVGLYLPGEKICLYDWGHDGTTDESSMAPVVCQQARSDCRPFAGDFDGDGLLDDVGFFDKTTGWWLFDHDHDGSVDERHVWGWHMAVPVAGAFGENEDPYAP